MEIGLGMMILFAVGFVYLGLNRPVETLARYADKECLKLEDEQTARHNEWYMTNVLKPEDLSEAAASRDYYKSLR
jgi:hypothetical protein